MDYSQWNHGIPENIERIIVTKGLKKCAVAERAGMTAQGLSDIFANRKLLRVHDLVRLAAALDVTPNDLMRTNQ